MKIWHFHQVTGELQGEGVAHEDPLEEGRFALPAFSTSDAPPDRQDGCALVYNSGRWLNLPDHRGETWWKADAQGNMQPGVVTYIGDPRLDGLTNIEPPAPPEPVPPPMPISARQIRIAMNRLGWRTDFEAYISSSDSQDTRDTWQFGTEFAIDGPILLGFGRSAEDIAAMFVPGGDILSAGLILKRVIRPSLSRNGSKAFAI